MTEAASSHITPGFCLSRAVAIPARIILASGILPRGLCREGSTNVFRSVKAWPRFEFGENPQLDALT